MAYQTGFWNKSLLFVKEIMQLTNSSPPRSPSCVVFLFYFKIYLFLAALGLHWCTPAFSSCEEQGLCNWGKQASHCGGFSCCRARVPGRMGFSSCGAWAELPHGMWDLPGSGIEPVSPALPGGFLTTGPPEKFLHCVLNYTISHNLVLLL